MNANNAHQFNDAEKEYNIDRSQNTQTQKKNLARTGEYFTQNDKVLFDSFVDKIYELDELDKQDGANKRRACNFDTVVNLIEIINKTFTEKHLNDFCKIYNIKEKFTSQDITAKRKFIVESMLEDIKLLVNKNYSSITENKFKELTDFVSKHQEAEEGKEKNKKTLKQNAMKFGVSSAAMLTPNIIIQVCAALLACMFFTKTICNIIKSFQLNHKAKQDINLFRASLQNINTYDLAK